MAETDAFAEANRLWPRSTSLFLLLVGLVLSIVSFLVVLNMPELRWEPHRDLELSATYDAYRETGVLLVKDADRGSPQTQTMLGGVADDELVPAAWDDDPGAYIAASLLGKLTGTESPYPGLALTTAFLIALPLLWLPTAVARIFRRARAGYALILLPPAMWLLNQGTILVGTEYGLSDGLSQLRVHAFYGIASSLVFLSLALVLYLSTFRLGWRGLLFATAVIAVLAGFADLAKALAGLGVALAVGVLWWLNSTGKWRWGRAAAATACAVALSFGVQAAVMGIVDVGREDAVASASQGIPEFHGTWQQLYLGLSYPEPITGQPSPFDVDYATAFAQAKAAEVDPDAVIGSAQYDTIMRDLYLDAVRSDPLAAIGTYLSKALFVIKQFGAMIAFIVVAFVVALTRRSPQRRLLGASIAIALPTVILGLLSPVLVMPDLYHYTEISAALGLLVAVSLGALVWSITSMPSHVRSTERSRLSGRLSQHFPASDERSHTSVIVPTRNGAEVIEGTVRALAARLREGDEIIVVENGSTDETTAVVERLAAEWPAAPDLRLLHSAPGLGEALRSGVLASTGQWLLLTADDLPFGFTDYEGFRTLDDDTVVAIGSKAHPDSQVLRSRRRVIQSRVFRFLRAALLQSKVGDSQGTIWVDGAWARSFAMLSRETGLMWTTELVLAAEQQQVVVREVPVSLSDAHETGSSRFRFSDAWQSVIGFTRLAIYKDDYANEVWTRTPADDGADLDAGTDARTLEPTPDVAAVGVTASTSANAEHDNT